MASDGAVEVFHVHNRIFYDLGIPSVLGSNTIDLYECLRANVWRSVEKGMSEVQDAYKQGWLVSHISHDKLALYTGMSRRSVIPRLRLLLELGWLCFPDQPSGHEHVYQLGQVLVNKPTDENREVYLADLAIGRMVEELEATLKEAGKKTLFRLPASERVEMVREYFATRTTLSTRNRCSASLLATAATEPTNGPPAPLPAHIMAGCLTAQDYPAPPPGAPQPARSTLPWYSAQDPVLPANVIPFPGTPGLKVPVVIQKTEEVVEIAGIPYPSTTYFYTDTGNWAYDEFRVESPDPGFCYSLHLLQNDMGVQYLHTPGAVNSTKTDMGVQYLHRQLEIPTEKSLRGSSLPELEFRNDTEDRTRGADAPQTPCVRGSIGRTRGGLSGGAQAHSASEPAQLNLDFQINTHTQTHPLPHPPTPAPSPARRIVVSGRWRERGKALVVRDTRGVRHRYKHARPVVVLEVSMPKATPSAQWMNISNADVEQLPHEKGQKLRWTGRTADPGDSPPEAPNSVPEDVLEPASPHVESTAERKAGIQAVLAAPAATSAQINRGREMAKKLQDEAAQQAPAPASKKTRRPKGAPTPELPAMVKTMYAQFVVAWPKLVPDPTTPKPVWTDKERSQLKYLLKSYGSQDIERAWWYLLDNWPALQLRLFKSTGGFPGVGVLLRLHGVLVPESHAWVKVARARKRLADWQATVDEDKNFFPPADIESELLEAEKAYGAVVPVPSESRRR